MYGAGQDYTLAALNVASKQSEEIKVYGTDLSPTLLEYLENGSLAACCGANWTNALYTAIMLENAMDGHKFTEEDGLPAIIEDAGFISVPASCADLYNKFFIEENPYEDSEIEAMLYRNNPDVTLDDLKDMIHSYSLEERMAAKLKAGKVTEEELTAAGLDISAYTAE